MRARTFILWIGLAAALAALPACKGGGPTGPEPPTGNITFRGTITSGGAPLAGVPVYLSGDVSKNTVTDAAGAFSFAEVAGTIFVVTPSLQNNEFTPSNYELSGQSRSDLAFAAGPATFGSVVGKIVANFTAVNQNGQPVSLYDYFGKVVLIDFSADWCGPCRNEAQVAESLYQSYKSKGFEMLTIMIDGSPSAWATTYGLTFSVLDDDAETLWAIFGEGYVPLNIVLDRNMTIRYKQAGYYESQITGTVKKFL